MAANATDALLDRLGENVQIDVNSNVRNNLLKLVGEDAQRRIVEAKEQSSEVGEVELPPLDPAEQDNAQLQIMEMHPLADTPWHEAFPWICCCLSLCSGEKKQRKGNEDLRAQIKEINQRLNKLIKNCDGPKYEGTNLQRDLSKKFGVEWIDKQGNPHKKKEKNQSAEDKANVFCEYGFGILAWIGTLRFPFLLYLILSLFAYLAMKQYASFSGLEYPESGFGSLAKYSMGNIGFSQSMCFFQYAEL